MIMKRTSLLILLTVVCLSAMGQGPLLDLPYFPYRTTKNIKVIRTYAVDTLTGARKLTHTERYDRNGYCDDTTYNYVYDAQGRLVLRESFQWVSTSDNSMPRREVESRCSIEYTADGIVQHIRYERFGKHYEGVSECHLLSYKEHPRFGMTECVYVYQRSFDTLRFLREFAPDGRLLHEYCNDEGGGYRDRKLYYDASGCIIASRTYYYESWDTLDYHYDANGVLVSQTGKMYDLDMEADVTITFRPDGTRVERREHWINYEDPTDTSDEYCRYDEHDVIIYVKDDRGVIEYEIEYWE